MRLGCTGTITNLLIFFTTPKNRYVNQDTQTMLDKLSYPKKPWNRKFQTPKNPSIIPSLELRSTSPHPQFSLGLRGRRSARAMRSFLSRLPHAKCLYMPKMTKFPNFIQTSFISTKLIEHRYLLVDIVLKEFPLYCLSNQEA